MGEASSFGWGRHQSEGGLHGFVTTSPHGRIPTYYLFCELRRFTWHNGTSDRFAGVLDRLRCRVGNAYLFAFDFNSVFDAAAGGVLAGLLRRELALSRAVFGKHRR